MTCGHYRILIPLVLQMNIFPTFQTKLVVITFFNVLFSLNVKWNAALHFNVCPPSISFRLCETDSLFFCVFFLAVDR